MKPDTGSFFGFVTGVDTYPGKIDSCGPLVCDAGDFISSHVVDPASKGVEQERKTAA
jgi:hypothetical protein